MDASALIGNAQTAYATSLQKQAAVNAQALTKGPSLAKGMDMKKAKSAAQQFEGFFVGQMMDSMEAGMEADPVFGGGSAEETWRSMLNQEYGKQVAKTGRLGVTDMVMKSMLQAQEQRTAAATGQPAPAIETAQSLKAKAAAEGSDTGLILNTPAGVLAAARYMPANTPAGAQAAARYLPAKR